MLKIKYILCLFSLWHINNVYSAPTLQFSFGTIKGVDLLSQTSGKPVNAFYGIPFAASPVGSLRFKPPLPYQGNDPSVVISSNGFRESCWQDSESEWPMSEDCLFLNIFSPASSAQTLRKVMVWVHGGGLEEGDALPYLPTDLVADYDVMVVTLQYRLGYLGFLGTGDEYATGNNGFRDQVLALRWVKDNIRTFGGDPDDVTLFGESAGGISASFLSLSPYSKGLFTKAIFISGNAFSMPEKTLTRDFVIGWVDELASRVGCLPWLYRLLPGRGESSLEEVFECLRGKPASVFTAPDVEVSVFKDLTKSSWTGPLMDRDFVPNFPRALLKNKKYLEENGVLNRSYIVGTNNKEGAMFSLVPNSDGSAFNSEDNLEKMIYHMSTYSFPLTTNKQVTNTINFLYSYPRNADGSPPVEGMVDLITDALFILPAVDLVTEMAQVAPNTPSFYYVFDHYPELTDGTTLNGTNHAMDLAFLFDDTEYSKFYTFGFPLNLATTAAQQMKDVYRGALTQFAKFGNPSRRTGNSPIIWPQYDLKNRSYMTLSPYPKGGKRIYTKRMSLWQDYLPTVASNLFGSQRFNIF